MQTTNNLNRRILIVDDNHAIHDDFRKIFGDDARLSPLEACETALFGNPVNAQSRATFELDFASQGQEALDLVQRSLKAQRPYAMAFMDVRMPPGLDGIETTAKIWELDPNLQVAICTAYSDYSLESIGERLRNADAFVILKKPFDVSEVKQLANAFTEKWNRFHGTQSKQTEQQRQLMEVQLRQAHKLEAIGQLAAGIAHEINTPTQYVGDNTRFLQESFQNIFKVLKSHEALLEAAKQHGLPAELIRNAEEILKAGDLEYLYEQIPAAIKETLEGVDRVTKIVRAMKEFSHPGGKEKSAADLNKAIETTVTVARNEWKYVADLKLDLDPGLPPIPCFIGEFNQAILNLLVNSAHAVGDVTRQKPGTKGLITLSTRRDGDCIEVRVTDTGTGISEAVRPRIFDPFFTTKEVGKGTGQGLSMVYGTIVNRHGGTVEFETEIGKGTTFILRLPISPRNNGSDSTLPPAEKRKASGKKNGTASAPRTAKSKARQKPAA